jgi:hypothetical protein
MYCLHLQSERYAKQAELPLSCLLHAWDILNPEDQNVAEFYRIVSENIVLFMVTDVRISNATKKTKLNPVA